MIIRKQIIFLLFLLLIANSCTSIRRSGYEFDNIKSQLPPNDCKIAIKKKYVFSDYDVDVLGEIKANFSAGPDSECSEEAVFTIFFKMPASWGPM